MNGSSTALANGGNTRQTTRKRKYETMRGRDNYPLKRPLLVRIQVNESENKKSHSRDIGKGK